jgi:D-alanyl-D-alanine carboxypeptidase
LDLSLRGWGFMILIADLHMRRTHRQPFIARFSAKAATLLTALVLCAALIAQPADAKRRKRVFYAPPQAAMVVDAHTGKILYESNPDEARFPASITKVMTLYLLFERLKEGKITLDTPLKVTAFAASQAPSKLGLQPGSTIAVKDAIYALVTKSANDCAVVVAENLAGSEDEFARQMTTKARSLGMTRTSFANASGLPNSEQRTTARDLVTLGRRILADFPDKASVFGTRVFTYNGESYRNHNGLLFTYRGTEGLKTGFTQASGFNLLTSVRQDNRHLVAVVLGGRSAVERNSRMRSLLNASWKHAIDGSKALIAKARIPASAPEPEVEFASTIADVPERNPAFHPSTSEKTMTVAMAAMLELDRQRNDATQASVAEAAAVETPAATAVASNEEASTEELASAAEEMSDEGQASQEEGDTTADLPPQPVLGPYHIQVGSYASALGAKTWLDKVAGKAKNVVDGHGLLTVQGEVSGQPRYRARFGQFKESEAKAACGKLKALAIDCMVVRAE